MAPLSRKEGWKISFRIFWFVFKNLGTLPPLLNSGISVSEEDYECSLSLLGCPISSLLISNESSFWSTPSVQVVFSLWTSVVGGVFHCLNWRVCSWHLTVEAKDAVKYPEYTGFPTIKNYLTLSVSIAQVEKPCLIHMKCVLILYCDERPEISQNLTPRYMPVLVLIITCT